ncbi:hypothetical protein A2526_01295 [candidate division WOR-1 bacterium RIFOXYD2_FULL_36_8]|uniref:Outer membrane protein beta-barrel domain-containing protein n=1 Tax=candidate division WOR-1 bacterium RIFOXYB2_FULL_36_35 TaxID=1802578 RepID=A0A1F4S736_UNCSA|nr:MAG: hypothetical protein A2230_08575 [candidate division WOR-1 bacterium RIFOXYA2_FULL_36_21]OGC16221.1 MAG: hypothetical protein A2290_00360 [candidate division WOR-1 bacterium RIFOXYB2_FULL_36_35]OGC19899.1 MAG: hypothetical protein A2282_04740 [candidate division WOR-1 bacterium RIFOXYA12_FULL_36_13]OGC39233.1 MAG: hypothetical protein A2526_01295 [candidate division WOR-1 bacterium RIFOXYD2_FULL_36_8]
MKKFIICLVAFAFAIGFANISFGRTMAEEMEAVRDYLNVVDAKLATAKQAHDNKRVDLLHAEKAATLARWNKLKASMVTPTPEPKPVIIRMATPEPVVVIVPNTKEAGRGVALYLNGGLDAGLIGYAANLDYDLSGLPAPGIKIRLGANYLSGTNPNGSDIVQAASAKVGFIYYISPYLSNGEVPLSFYVGSAYLVPVKVNNGRTGTSHQWGLEAYLGINYSIIEMGIINFEVGYSGLKYAEDQPALKGLDIKLGYGITF